jgi:hypothetical protein
MQKEKTQGLDRLQQLLTKIDTFTKFIMQSKIQHLKGQDSLNSEAFKQMQQAAIQSIRMVGRNEPGADHHTARRKQKKDKIVGEGGAEAEQEADFTLTRLESQPTILKGG